MSKTPTLLPLERSAGFLSRPAKRKRQEQMDGWVGVREFQTEIIPLLNGKFAKVDDSDFAWLNQWNWECSTSGYAYRRWRIDGKTYYIYMHKAILQLKGGRDMEADHKNLDKLDNRRFNLRPCFHFQNGRNLPINQNRKIPKKCKYKGVGLHHTGKYSAIGVLNYKAQWLGLFNTQEEAGLAYNNWAIMNFGEFARLNPL